MFIREYRSSDCKELTELFYNTVHIVNAKDYNKEQLDVWATGQVDLKKWSQQFKRILLPMLLLQQDLFLKKEDIKLLESNR